MWGRMLPETKDLVVDALVKEYGNEARTIRNVWIYGGAIPKKNLPRVVEVCQNALRIQEQKTLAGI